MAVRRIPLTTLLSWSWIAHTMEVDNTFEAAMSERTGRQFRISLPMWSNGLRFVDDEGITVDSLRTLARAACNIGGLERWGWIRVGDGAAKRRDGFGTHRGVKGDTVLRPTRAGRYARQGWPVAVAEVEDRWRSRFGGHVIDALWTALHGVGTSMPWSPPEVNPSNGFRTQVLSDAFIDADDVDAPLVARLGQVLTALTLAHEHESEVSLPLGANFLRVIDHEVLTLRSLPDQSGISKEGVAMATGYLERHGLSSALPERAMQLTPAGLDALDGYRHRSDRADQASLRLALEAVVDQQGALSAGLVPPEGGWRGEKPYLARTRRLIAEPTAHLPWHPMVLHRGGWPDAS